MDSAPARGELTVSEVTRHVRELIEGAAELTRIWVRGEASNVRLAGSGHLYFTMKDSQAQLKVAYFRFGKKRKPPADGDALLVHGDVRVYEPRGEYQLIADDLIKAGLGDLAAQFEALKKKLDSEGLFSAERKVSPPRVPRRIGVVTGIATAALQDVLNVLRRRAPYLEVVLFAASVQGAGAPPELIAALQAADECPGIEVILLVRGGGSLEDLWCFNDETLARALAAIERPVISGVGHEIDFTIADFVADRRAPTPSAAAELVAPDATELRGGVDAGSARLLGLLKRGLEDAEADLSRLFDRRVVRDVLGRLESDSQDLDMLAARLAESGAGAVMLDEERGLEEYIDSLAGPLMRRLEDAHHDLPRLRADLLRTGRNAYNQQLTAVANAESKLKAGDPRAPKKLGFALVWDKDGKLVRDAAAVKPGDSLRVEVREGEMDVERK